MDKAAFAAGCFWGVEKIFLEISGVISTQVGYAGGETQDPTYEEICEGETGHAEAVEITYDPAKVPYEKLLLTFWENHDPSTLDRQGPDVGSQYRSVIFYYTPEQQKIATQSKELLDQAKIWKGPIVTEIIPAPKFYRAEEYHQKYLKKNPGGYCSHHFQSPKIGEVLRRGILLTLLFILMLPVTAAISASTDEEAAIIYTDNPTNDDATTEFLDASGKVIKDYEYRDKYEKQMKNLQENASKPFGQAGKKFGEAKLEPMKEDKDAKDSSESKEASKEKPEDPKKEKVTRRVLVS